MDEDQADNGETTVSNIDIIPERDVRVTGDPTDVWLLETDSEGNFRLYEQWERDRPFKAKAVFHHPSGTDFYMKNGDDPFGVKVTDTDTPLDDELELAPERPGQRYRLEREETIWTVARKFKLSATKLMDYNEIDDPKSLTPGMWVYIPKHEVKNRPDIEYKVLANPLKMHVTLKGGTTKWRFGNVRKWADIRPEAKHYDEGHNVDIHAVAKVPVEGVIAAYYMDRHDLGDFTATGRPTYTRGFNWQHLGEGHTAAEKAKPVIDELIQADAMREDDRPSPPAYLETAPDDVAAPVTADTPAGDIEPAGEPQAVAAPQDIPEDYKATFKYLNVEESPERFELLKSLDIRELDGAHAPIPRKEGDRVMVSGWFTHQGTPYYRLATRYWFAIPTQYAHSIENEPFRLDVDFPTRARHGLALSKEERRMVMVAKAAAKYNKFRTLAGLLRRKQ